nr:hypothetical protein Iba_chr14dCG3390 [Ipomoea batatas]
MTAPGPSRLQPLATAPPSDDASLLYSSQAAQSPPILHRSPARQPITASTTAAVQSAPPTGDHHNPAAYNEAFYTTSDFVTVHSAPKSQSALRLLRNLNSCTAIDSAQAPAGLHARRRSIGMLHAGRFSIAATGAQVASNPLHRSPAPQPISPRSHYRCRYSAPPPTGDHHIRLPTMKRSIRPSISSQSQRPKSPIISATLRNLNSCTAMTAPRPQPPPPLDGASIGRPVASSIAATAPSRLQSLHRSPAPQPITASTTAAVQSPPPTGDHHNPAAYNEAFYTTSDFVTVTGISLIS